MPTPSRSTRRKASPATPHTFVADESLYREAAYTALSRGRDAKHLYVTPRAGIDDSHLPDDGGDESGLDALGRALANSRQQRLASFDLWTLAEVTARGPAVPIRSAAIESDLGLGL